MVVAEKKAVKKIPEGYTAVTPWIISPNSARVISFMQNAFGAEEIPGSRTLSPEGKIVHVEVKVGDAVVMLFDSAGSWPSTPAFIRLFVDNCESAYQTAIKAGARAVTKPTMLAFGDKVGRVADPFGNLWWLQEHVEDLSSMNPDDLIIKMKEPAAVKAMKYVEDSLHSELAKRSYPASL
ncbi:MAG TPA: VOC family protein [Cyclobacteriaceae bacterium]|nr:VOC family protein [Cyclobacteriaceae bacterium]